MANTGDRGLDARKAVMALFGRPTLVAHYSLTTTNVQVSAQLEENGLYMFQADCECNVRFQFDNTEEDATTVRNEGVYVPAGGTYKFFLKNDTRYISMTPQADGEVWLFKLD
jgi:hypothetical protein